LLVHDLLRCGFSLGAVSALRPAITARIALRRVFLKVLKVLQALPWNDSGVRWTSECFFFVVCGQPAEVSKARCPTELRAGRTDSKA
jgi:hypothetical protein